MPWESNITFSDSNSDSDSEVLWNGMAEALNLSIVGNNAPPPQDNDASSSNFMKKPDDLPPVPPAEYNGEMFHSIMG